MEAIETHRTASLIRESFETFFGSWRNQAILYVGVLALATGGALVAEVRFQVPRPIVLAVTIASTVIFLALAPILSVVARWFADSFVLPVFAPAAVHTDLYAETVAQLMLHDRYTYDRATLERELEIIKRHTAELLEAEHEHKHMFEIARQRLGRSHQVSRFPKWAEDETTYQLEFTKELLQIIEAQRKTLLDSCGVVEAQRLFYAAVLAHITTQVFEEQLRHIEEKHPDDNIVAAVENLREAVRAHTD